MVGDGAVGLCGVLAAAELGAERIVAMSRHEPRQKIAEKFGATHVVAERGEDGEQQILDLTDGVGADAVLECVGTDASMDTAFNVARPGSTVGFVGVPHGVELPVRRMFGKNVGLAGGMAPVRTYLPDLLDRVLGGPIDPAWSSTSRCRWTRWPRATRRWTSAARSRCCCAPDSCRRPGVACRAMKETPEEIAALQDLLDRSHGGATSHLRGIISDDRRLTAQDIVALLTGMKVISVATVTAPGHPRISAMDGHFLHGTWSFSTSGTAAKARHMRAPAGRQRRPRRQRGARRLQPRTCRGDADDRRRLRRDARSLGLPLRQLALRLG